VSKVLHEHIKATTPEARYPESFSAPAQPAAEDELAEFLAAAIRPMKPDLVLETGTAFGHTAKVMAEALVKNGFGHLHTIELKPARYQMAETRLESLPATIHKGKWEGVTFPDDYEFHVAFFDATRANRDGEFHHFRPWIPTGAIVGFHDTGMGRQRDLRKPKLAEMGVQNLIDEGRIKPIYFPCPRGFTLAEVV
jgi:predicted O-methyltransferase YrrM